MNHLEQLVAEWLQHNGYFARTSVPVGPRDRGGYEGELDVVGLHLARKRLVHIECSLDADSASERQAKFAKKFEWTPIHRECLCRCRFARPGANFGSSIFGKEGSRDWRSAARNRARAYPRNLRRFERHLSSKQSRFVQFTPFADPTARGRCFKGTFDGPSRHSPGR